MRSKTVITAAAITAGFAGVLVFLAAAILGRVLHEMVTYVQHYGLVRVAIAPIKSRHSWDCGRVISNALLYKSTPARRPPPVLVKTVLEARRSGRVSEASARLRDDGHWWNKLIGPLLADWDQRLANDGERSLVRERGWTIDAPLQTALKIGQGR